MMTKDWNVARGRMIAWNLQGSILHFQHQKENKNAQCNTSSQSTPLVLVQAYSRKNSLNPERPDICPVATQTPTPSLFSPCWNDNLVFIELVSNKKHFQMWKFQASYSSMLWVAPQWTGGRSSWLSHSVSQGRFYERPPTGPSYK